MQCTMYEKYCHEHGFVHGGEAEELRGGIEFIVETTSVETEEEQTILDRLQALLDRVDARDSLAFVKTNKCYGCQHRFPLSVVPGRIRHVDPGGGRHLCMNAQEPEDE